MKIPCYLTFSSNGRVAEVRHAQNGLLLARLSVQGPFERNARAVHKEKEECTFNAEVVGLADWEYVDHKGTVCKRRSY